MGCNDIALVNRELHVFIVLALVCLKISPRQHSHHGFNSYNVEANNLVNLARCV